MFTSRLDDSYDADVRRAIVPITAAKMGANSAVRFAPPFIATIASGLDVSLTTLGAAIAVGELVGLSGPIVARFAGRLNRRTAVTAGLLGIATGASVSATARTAIQFAAGLAVMTISKIVFDLGIISWITDRVPYSQLGRVVGLTETAWAGSLFIGVVLMGLVTGLTSWRWGYMLAIVAILFLTAILRGRLARTRAPVRASPAGSGFRWSSGPRLGPGWLVIIATIALTASAQSVFVTFGKWLQNDFGFSDTDLSITVFGFGGVELIAAATSVRFADAWGKQRSTMFGAMAIVPAALLFVPFNTNLVLGLLVLALWVCAFEFSIVATLSLASNLVPDRPSTGLGFMVGAATLGRALMSPSATAAYSSQGMWLVAVLGASCAAVSFGCQWRYRSVRASGRSGQPA